MRNRIRELRKARGLTMAELGDAAGTEAPTINKLEKGQMRLTDVWMQRIAKALGVQVAELITEAPPPEAIFVRGRVQAGAWAESLEWDADERYPVWVPIPEKWRAFNKFGLEVRGPSMNRRYPEGTILVCVSVIEADVEPQQGHRYIVERIDSAGQHEMTVKELKFDDDGKAWLWPDSDHPEHQAPIAADGGDGDSIEIRGIVITSVQPE